MSAINQPLLSFYASARRKGFAPVKAIRDARERIAKGEKTYCYSSRILSPSFGLGAKGKDDGLQWCEDPSAFGLRFVGNADDLARIDHKGWYIATFQSDTIQGVVYQLPARNGKCVYVVGHDDACNPGSARLDFSDLIYGEADDSDDAKRDAARRADSIAENAAESMREYDEAWQAGQRAAELHGEAVEARVNLLAFLRDVRAKRSTLCDAPALIAAAREHVEDLLKTIRETRAKRDTLREDNRWGKYVAAFDDGYGA